jgi:glycolate oxidase FAD binding subunit
MAQAANLRPADRAELAAIIADARARGTRLRLRGGGTKDAVGAPCPAAVVDMRAFSGVIDYDPSELVLTVGAGTPLTGIERLLAEQGQMLAFAPWDAGCLFGKAPGEATIGGTVMAGLSGSQRLTQGAARDHFLGLKGVTGGGTPFTAGAKVVKNVTGYDLPKLLAGSWGRLAAVTELTLKVLPRPAGSLTVVAEGLTPREAWRAMATLLGSNAELAAAAHLPAGLAGGASLTAVRVQGFAPSVEARCRIVEEMAAGGGRFARVAAGTAGDIWEALRSLRLLPGDRPLWRISLPARSGPDFVAQLGAGDSEWLMDWAGALIWYAGAADAATIRRLAGDLGGHATLMRGDEELRMHVPAFHPLPPSAAALEAAVRRAFDPAGLFDTGRF